VSAGREALARLIAQALEEVAREVARDEARRAALEALAEAGGGQPRREWLSQVQAGELAGVTPQTIREWLEAGHLGERGRRGAVHVERLRAHLAGKGSSSAPARARGQEIAAAALAAGGGRR
jgi:hypothetical protein